MKMKKVTILKRMNALTLKQGTAVFLFAFFLGVSHLFPEIPVNIKKIPLPSTIMAREQLASAITGPLKAADSLLPTVFQDGIHGNFINFFIKKDYDDIQFYFSLDNGLDFNNVKKGSCIIIRARTAEKKNPVREIRFYLKDDPDSYVQIIPDKDLDESLLRIYLYGNLMQTDIKVPLPIEKIVSTPFDTIEKLTSGYVNWGFYLPDPRFIYSDDVLQLSMRILPLLRFLHDADDGAMDKNGRFVYIKTLKEQQGTGGLNCSGFAKWVIDGLYYYKKKSFLDISLLKQKHPADRGNKWSRKLEDRYDPYFGLDWTRNLAWAYEKINNPGAGYRSSDVTDLSFQSYVNNVGFPVKSLKTVLYELAVSDPEYFYLGAVNMITDNPPGLRKYLHVIVLFPAIDSLGRFSYVILSRNKEISLKELEMQYPDSFVHLVRIRADNHFDPPGIKFDPVLRRLF